MKYAIYILIAALNIPFAIQGSVINAVAFGFIIGVIFTSILNDSAKRLQ